MNTQISIDVEMLEALLVKTLLRLAEKSKTTKKYLASYAAALRSLAPMFLEFEAMDIDLDFSLNDGDINFWFSGDGEKLKAVWALLRRNGYVPSERPEPGKTSVTTFWTQAEFPRFYMSFTSSVCKRVQVGTEMREVPIYETQCGELPILELDAPPTVVAAPLDIPF